jgi:HEAT repeat protein
VAPPEGFPISKGLRYAGQTFNQWQEKLLFELSPAQRTEAIQAMEMFGRHGLGKEATRAIMAAMRDTDTWVIDNSPEGMMKHAAIDAIGKIPAADSTPVLVEALASENEFERALAARMMPDRSQLNLLLKATKDESPMVRAAALTRAARLDHDSPEVLEALRKGLDDPAARVALAAASSLIGDRPGALSDDQAKQVTAALARLLDDHDLGIRMHGDIFRLLQELGGQAAGAAGALERLISQSAPDSALLSVAKVTLKAIQRATIEPAPMK